MRMRDFIKLMQEGRHGSLSGPKTKSIGTLKPGREVRQGVLCYDGSGPSGYRGRCNTSKSNQPTPA